MSKYIAIDDVQSVYSGRPGCCCGCRGKHTYRPGAEKLGKKLRGYEISANECRMATLTSIVNKINDDSLGGEIEDNGNHVCRLLEGRWYIAYRVDTERGAALDDGKLVLR